jgi:hypothetical protein
MKRRDILQAGSVTLVFAFAGCANNQEQNKTSEQSPTTGNSETTTVDGAIGESTTAETTAGTTTTVRPAEEEYELGEPYVYEQWKIAVTDLELMTAFQTDDGGTYDAPDGTKLAITTVELTNQSSEGQTWAGMPFALVFKGRIYEDKRGFKHPQFSGHVAMNDLKSIEHARQYAPESYPVDSGESILLWALFLIPEDATLDRTSVGFDGEPNEGTAYPVRWVPN